MTGHNMLVMIIQKKCINEIKVHLLFINTLYALLFLVLGHTELRFCTDSVSMKHALGGQLEVNYR
jgi:hypothetical protein